MELLNVSGGSEVVDGDATLELDINDFEVKSLLGGTVESGPELEVDGTIDSDILVGSGGSPAVSGGQVAEDINDRVLAILVREAGEGDVEHEGSQSGVGTVNDGDLVSIEPSINISGLEE